MAATRFAGCVAWPTQSSGWVGFLLAGPTVATAVVPRRD